MLTSIALTSDVKYIISGSADKSIKVWDYVSYNENQKAVYCIKDAHEDKVESVAVTHNNRYMVTGSYKVINIWDL